MRTCWGPREATPFQSTIFETSSRSEVEEDGGRRLGWRHVEGGHALESEWSDGGDGRALFWEARVNRNVEPEHSSPRSGNVAGSPGNAAFAFPGVQVSPALQRWVAEHEKS